MAHPGEFAVGRRDKSFGPNDDLGMALDAKKVVVADGAGVFVLHLVSERLHEVLVAWQSLVPVHREWETNGAVVGCRA